MSQKQPSSSLAHRPRDLSPIILPEGLAILGLAVLTYTSRSCAFSLERRSTNLPWRQVVGKAWQWVGRSETTIEVDGGGSRSRPRVLYRLINTYTPWKNGITPWELPVRRFPIGSLCVHVDHIQYIYMRVDPTSPNDSWSNEQSLLSCRIRCWSTSTDSRYDRRRLYHRLSVECDDGRWW